MPQNAPGLQKDVTEKQGLHPESVFLTAFNKQEEKITHFRFFSSKCTISLRICGKSFSQFISDFQRQENVSGMNLEPPRMQGGLPYVRFFLRSTTRTFTHGPLQGHSSF